MSVPPPSLLRKTGGKSLSMGSATRTSILLGAPRTSLDPVPGPAFLGTNSKRRSLLSTPASTNKRRQSNALQPPISLHSNNSSLAQNPPSSQGSHNTPQPQMPSSQVTPNNSQQSQPSDQRPLRDKGYQQVIQQQIYDYLVLHKYEVETNQAISLKTLRQPTQKEFISMFKFLYHRLDPYYEFHRSIELEIFSLLKSLGYPYLDSINRSQISAVGGQNWPSFLGVLHWLVKLGGAVTDVEEIGPDDEFDKIFIRYIKDSYREFISENDDYSEFYERLQVDFRKLNAQLVQDSEQLEAENDTLRNQHAELERQLDELRFAEKKSLALEEDLIKFKAYIEAMESRKSKWAEIRDKIKEEITAKEAELESLTNEQKQLEAQLAKKGTSAAEINSMNAERDRLSRSIDTETAKLERMQHTRDERETELTKNYQSLQNFVKTYNSMVARFKDTDHDFEIKVNPREHITALSVIDKVLKDEKIALLTYRSELKNKIHQLQDEHIKCSELRDQEGEKILEQNERVESLVNKLTQNKMNYDEIYEAMVNDNTTYSTQIEKLERELRSIKINTNQGFIELENQYQNVLIAHDELQHNITKARQDLYDRCCKMAEFIMNFKYHIQRGLLELDDMASAEYESTTDACN